MKVIELKKATVNFAGEIREIKDDYKNVEEDVFFRLPEKGNVLATKMIDITGFYSEFKCPPFIKNMIIPRGYESIRQKAFINCSNLEQVIFEGDKEEPSHLKNIGWQAFYNCSNLKYVKFPTTIKCVQLDTEIFSNCKNLAEVDFNNIIIHSIPRRCFFLTSLNKVEIPYGCIGIGESAFEMASLNEVVFSETVRNIGSKCFDGNHLKKIYLNKIENIGDKAFSSNEIEEVNAPYLTIIKSRAFAFNKINVFKISPFATKIENDIFFGNIGSCVKTDNFKIFI